MMWSLKCIKMIFNVLGVVLLLSCSAYAHDEEVLFLQRLGFNDLVSEINKSQTNQNLSKVSAIALKENKEKYQIVNEARELSVFVYKQISLGLSNPRIQDKAARLSAHLLRPVVEMKNIQIPQYFRDDYKSDQYKKETSKYLEAAIDEIQNKELQYLSAFTIDLIQDSLKRLLTEPEKIDVILMYKKYLDLRANHTDIAGTNYLGRALVVLLVRHARLQKSFELENKISLYLEKQKDFLNNYVSSSYSLISREGELKTIQLKSGDFVHEYSNEAESYLISAGVLPGNTSNKAMADKLGLVNSLTDIRKFPSPQQGKSIEDKIRSNEPLNEKEQFLYMQTKSSTTGLGFSHVGLVSVKNDEQTGIALSWVLDVFPSGDYAGGRYIGLEGFAPPEKIQKIGFSRYNAKAFMQYFKMRKAKEGYLPYVWKTYEADVTNEGTRINQSPRKVFLKSKISENEMKALLSFSEEDAQKWYEQQIVPRVLRAMLDNVVSEQAVVFAKSFINIEGAKYCSQAIVLAYLQAVNIDPQPTYDEWKKTVAILGRLIPKIGSKLDLGERIISPSGLCGSLSYQKVFRLLILTV